MKNLLDNKKAINITLIAVALIILCSCLYIITHLPSRAERDVILVEDRTKPNLLVSDNEYYNKERYTKSEGKEPVVYTAESPEGMLNPEDTIEKGGSGTNKQKDKEEDSIITYIDNSVSTFINVKPISSITEPFVLYGEGEIIDVISEEPIPETTEEDDKFSQVTLNMLLNIAREERNKGRTQLSKMFRLINSDYKNVYFSDVAENGAVVIPFLLTDVDLNYIKSIESIYNQYKDQINFVFVDYAIDGLDTIPDIKAKFEENGISPNLPIYLDTLNEISNVTSNANYRYFYVNYDCFICGYSNVSDKMPTISTQISTIHSEKINAIEEDERVEQEYRKSLVEEVK